MTAGARYPVQRGMALRDVLASPCGDRCLPSPCWSLALLSACLHLPPPSASTQHKI